jgi:curved DNA-binding protein CbpA
MGNTPTKDKQQHDMYASYIQHQQNLIMQQQQQINSLFQFGLDNHQTPQNIVFQNQQPQMGQSYMASQQHQQQQQHQQKRLPSGKHKLDPYKILNLPKQFDEKMLKKAYLKAAMVSHPDRGGTRDAFQRVSIAYTVLTKKLKESQNNHSHNDLREMSRDYSQQQMNQPKVNVNMQDSFDVNLFNKIYDENKIQEVFDNGYGDWMNQNQISDGKQQKMFQDGFNKDLFNSTFENYKKEQAAKHGTQMVKYEEPEVRISMSNQDSLMVLGRDKVANFGGQTDNLSYTDYKQAFTDGSTLIDTSTVDITGRSTSINGIKSQRSNISYNMNSEDQQRYSLQQLEQQKAEENRLKRLQVYDQKQGDAYEKIHNLLLR